MFYAVGFAYQFVIDTLFSDYSITLLNGFDLFPFLAIGVAGLVIGILQWFSIYKEIKKSFKWGLISALSWGTAILISQLISLSLNSFMFGLITGLIVGVISGLFVEKIIIAPQKQVV